MADKDTRRLFILQKILAGARRRSSIMQQYVLQYVQQNMFIYFLIEIDFLNTRPGQSYFPLANQNTHLTTHEPIKIRVIKVKIKLKAGERRVHEKRFRI